MKVKTEEMTMKKMEKARMNAEKRDFLHDTIYDLKNNKFLILLCIPAIAWFLLFCYLPMFGLLVAFKKFSPTKGIFGSPWVGLGNFKFFFGSRDFFTVTFNTLFLNALFILSTTVASILIAIVLSEIQNKYFKKVSQSMLILPHFISWTVVALFLEAFISTDGGIVNRILVSWNLPRINFYKDASLWPWLLTALKVWQGAGYGSIVYLAAITGMDKGIFEAARIDGASRMQCIRFLTLPLLKATAVLLLIMSVGKIFNGDFGMIYALVGVNANLYSTTDVIDTYVYRQLMEAGNMGMSSAVGFYQSVMGLIMVYIANLITRKLSPESSLF